MIGRHLTRFVVATATTALVLGIVVRAQQPPAATVTTTQTPAVQTAAEKFKNIQILKTLPADQLPNAMQFIAASLGVQCGFCHVQGPDGWHFDSDDKPTKGTARKMLQMVNAFNAGNNPVTITCTTCHHGEQEPARTPPLATEMTPEEAARAASARASGPGRQGAPGGGTAAQAGAPAAAPGGRGRGPARPTETVDEVLQKYVQAVGGASAWSQAKTIALDGTVTTRDLQSTPVKVEETIAGAYRADMQSPRGAASRVFDGSDAWMTMGGNARDLEGIQAQQAGRLADFGLPVNAKQWYTNLTVQRYVNVDGVPAIMVTGRRAPDVTEQLLFDKESGLLLRRNISTRTALGTLGEQITYGDYRDVSGIKVPFQVRYATWNQLSTYKFSDAKLNPSIDESRFKK